MLNLDYTDPEVPGPAPPGRGAEAPNPKLPPLRVRVFDFVTDHPRKLIAGWFTLAGLVGSASNRPEWVTWGVFIPAMATMAIGALAVAIRMVSGLRPRGPRA